MVHVPSPSLTCQITRCSVDLFESNQVSRLDGLLDSNNGLYRHYRMERIWRTGRNGHDGIRKDQKRQHWETATETTIWQWAHAHLLLEVLICYTQKPCKSRTIGLSYSWPLTSEVTATHHSLVHDSWNSRYLKPDNELNLVCDINESLNLSI